MYRVSTGPRLNTLNAELENSLAHSEIDVRPESKQQFKTRVYVLFIKALISLIKNRFPDTGIFAAFAILGPGKLPSSQEEMVSQSMVSSCRDTLEKHYGRGDGAIIGSVTIKGERFELRLYLSMHCRALSMAEMLKLLTS